MRIEMKWGEGLLQGGGGGERKQGLGPRNDVLRNSQSDPLGSGFKKGRENFPY